MQSFRWGTRVSEEHAIFRDNSSKDGHGIFLQNVGIHLPDYMVFEQKPIK
jgi:hypothetical protein